MDSKQKDRKRVILVWAVSTMAVCIVFCGLYIYITKKNPAVLEIGKAHLTLSDSIKDFISQMNIDYPDIVYAQAVLETGTFTSAVFKNDNNLFGMRKTYSRPTTQIGADKNLYGIYESWKMSIIDYALWQAYTAKKLTRNEYLQLLQNSYAESPAYVTFIKQLMGDKR